MQNLRMTGAARSTESSVAAENARFMTRVYGWMTVGICLTGVVSWEIGQNQELAIQIASNRVLFWALVIAQLGAVLVLSVWMKRLNSIAAALVYLTYAALTGTTLSVIFLVYTQGSIAQVFGLTAFSFAGLTGFGLVTKRDLGPIGSFCSMGLFGMIGYGLMSFFFPSMLTGVANQVYSLVGVVVFAGLTAYDTQKIKQMNILGNEGTDEDRKEAIFGALTLYLDFINLFLSLLRLLGKSRD
jgi:FtsH-binding integral membrane protein